MRELLTPVPERCEGCPRLPNCGPLLEKVALVEWLQKKVDDETPDVAIKHVNLNREQALNAVTTYNAKIEAAELDPDCPGNWEVMVIGRNGLGQQYSHKQAVCGQKDQVTVATIQATRELGPGIFDVDVQYHRFEKSRGGVTPVQTWFAGELQEQA